MFFEINIVFYCSVLYDKDVAVGVKYLMNLYFFYFSSDSFLALVFGGGFFRLFRIVSLTFLMRLHADDLPSCR